MEDKYLQILTNSQLDHQHHPDFCLGMYISLFHSPGLDGSCSRYVELVFFPQGLVALFVIPDEI